MNDNCFNFILGFECTSSKFISAWKEFYDKRKTALTYQNWLIKLKIIFNLFNFKIRTFTLDLQISFL